MTLALPADLPRTYRYRFRADLFAGSWRYSYELVGAAGGLHLHVTGPHHYQGADHYSAGLEKHLRSAPSNEPPSQDECWLLKCPCWHDGTTMYAEERFLPVHLAGDYGRVFRMLAEYADSALLPAKPEAT